jgi:hypothetical protein
MLSYWEKRSLGVVGFVSQLKEVWPILFDAFDLEKRINYIDKRRFKQNKIYFFP